MENNTGQQRPSEVQQEQNNTSDPSRQAGLQQAGSLNLELLGNAAQTPVGLSELNLEQAAGPSTGRPTSMAPWQRRYPMYRPSNLSYKESLVSYFMLD